MSKYKPPSTLSLCCNLFTTGNSEEWFRRKNQPVAQRPTRFRNRSKPNHSFPEERLKDLVVGAPGLHGRRPPRC
ncbi:hypothetical protein F2Q69_00017965 [Brassica cretica]|uniref:Uncharacterized protein n=1 Tax=Brassica cretica TaxID=69181 RepID=A0A8S9RA59_BRACR|nr:hypothetical protein F2Q69_00017965 [Brassica cretica]